MKKSSSWVEGDLTREFPVEYVVGVVFSPPKEREFGFGGWVFGVGFVMGWSCERCGSGGNSGN